MIFHVSHDINEGKVAWVFDVSAYLLFFYYFDKLLTKVFQGFVKVTPAAGNV